MSDPLHPALDPSLGRATRVGHIVLFVLGTPLLVPAFFVLSLAVTSSFLSHNADALALPLIAIGGSATGILAWTALGLLFFKPADRAWHRLCWGTVALFGAVAGLGSILWLAAPEPSPDIIQFILIAVLFTSVASIGLGARNFLQARRPAAGFRAGRTRAGRA